MKLLAEIHTLEDNFCNSQNTYIFLEFPLSRRESTLSHSEPGTVVEEPPMKRPKLDWMSDV